MNNNIYSVSHNHFDNKTCFNSICNAPNYSNYTNYQEYPNSKPIFTDPKTCCMSLPTPSRYNEFSLDFNRTNPYGIDTQLQFLYPSCAPSMDQDTALQILNPSLPIVYGNPNIKTIQTAEFPGTQNVQTNTLI